MRGAFAVGLCAALAACGKSYGTDDPPSVVDAGTPPSLDAGVADASEEPDAATDSGTGSPLVLSDSAQSSAQAFDVQLLPTPAPNDLLILAIATRYRSAPIAPTTNGQPWTQVDSPSANAGLSVWQRTADGTERSVSGTVPDASGSVMLLTGWRGFDLLHSHSADSGGTAKVDPSAVDARPGSVVIGFVAAAADLQSLQPSAPFRAIDSDLSTPGLTLFGAHDVVTSAATLAPSWTLPQNSGWDAVTLSLSPR